jgi:hypothetical protein
MRTAAAIGVEAAAGSAGMMMRLAGLGKGFVGAAFDCR